MYEIYCDIYDDKINEQEMDRWEWETGNELDDDYPYEITDDGEWGDSEF
jgi:hypothetical protein